MNTTHQKNSKTSPSRRHILFCLHVQWIIFSYHICRMVSTTTPINVWIDVRLHVSKIRALRLVPVTTCCDIMYCKLPQAWVFRWSDSLCDRLLVRLAVRPLTLNLWPWHHTVWMSHWGPCETCMWCKYDGIEYTAMISLSTPFQKVVPRLESCTHSCGPFSSIPANSSATPNGRLWGKTKTWLKACICTIPIAPTIALWISSN